jgi:periplasmic divalent cation tolerance protein
MLYVTAENREEATAIGRSLVEERLVACANVIDGMTSIYSWKGNVEETGETVLLLKTRQSLVDPVIKRINELHSYDVPCVLSWNVENGHREFLQWVETETIPAVPPPVA